MDSVTMIHKLDRVLVVFPPDMPNEQKKFLASMKKMGFKTIVRITDFYYKFSKESAETVRNELRLLYSGGVFEEREYPNVVAEFDENGYVKCHPNCQDAYRDLCECPCLGRFHKRGMHWSYNVGKPTYSVETTTVHRWFPPLGEIMACGLHEKDWWWPDGRLKSQDGRKPEEL